MKTILTHAAAAVAGVLAALALTGGAATASAALPYYETHKPTGDPKGVVIVLHKGGWASSAAAIRKSDDERRRLVTAGFLVIQASYTSNNGPAAVGDVINFYDYAEAVYPAENVCVMGQSAGAHLALMAAAIRQDIPCVVSQAGPTDLTRTDDSAELSVSKTTAFGTNPDTLRFWSPITHAWVFAGRSMFGHARNDLVVQYNHSTNLAWKVGAPVNEMKLLGFGATVAWVHSYVYVSDLNAHYSKVFSFIAGKLAAAPTTAVKLSPERKRVLGL
jgi:acetyl esterase/lipase